MPIYVVLRPLTDKEINNIILMYKKELKRLKKFDTLAAHRRKMVIKGHIDDLLYKLEEREIDKDRGI